MNLNAGYEDILIAVRDVLQFQLFELNGTPITPSSILMFLVVIVVFYFVSRILNRGILKRLLGRFELEDGLRFTMVRTAHYLTMIVGAIVAFQFVGINLSGLAVIFGLLSVGIGFGLQNVTSNFVAGLILLFERPIKVGDRVTVGEVEGGVVDIRMRATMIRSLTNIAIIVPNSEFVSGRVVNWSHGDPKIRIDLEVGVSYDSDLDRVVQSLHEVAEENQHVLKSPPPDVLLTSFGDSSWNMQLRVWLPDPHRHYQARSEINCAIVRKFRQNNIEIPYPQRDLHVRSPLPIPVGGAVSRSE